MRTSVSVLVRRASWTRPSAANRAHQIRPAFWSCWIIRCLILGACLILPPALPAAAPPQPPPPAWNAEALATIGRLQSEKANRSPLHRKLDSQLVYALKGKRVPNWNANAPHHRPGLNLLPADEVLVDIDGDISPQLIQQVKDAGGRIMRSVPSLGSLRARVSLDALEGLAARKEVRRIRPAADATTNVGSRETEGGITHGTDLVRSLYQIDGTGMKVGVLSDSVDSLAAAIGSGDLPAVTVLPGQAGSGSGEGTAMLEIIHDIAPGADLYFATAFESEAGFAQNIRALHAAGCRIIVDDVTYFRESPFQDDVIARAVADVSAAGTLYFSSIGNSGNKNDATSGTWEGNFRDGGPTLFGGTGRLHDFGGTVFNTVLAGGGKRRVDLFWSDPLGHSANDYDVYVLNSAGQVIASSTNIQDGNDDPYESLNSIEVGDRIVIVKQRGQDRFLHLSTGRARVQVSTDGAARGHNASGAENAFSIAATPVGGSPSLFTAGSSRQVELFSSDGPRRMFYTADGTPLTPGNLLAGGGVALQKPDLTAADGVSTATPQFQPFFGTSAAAPHAAAIASLVWSYNPSLSAAEVRQALLATALDIEASGVDENAGHGVVMPGPAIEAVPQPQARLALSTVSLQDANGNGRLDANECATLSLGLRNLLAASGEPATHVAASLVSLDPEVVVDPAPRSFPDIAPQTITSNTLPFRLSSHAFLACDRPVRLKLAVAFQDGVTQEFPFELGTGSPGGAAPVTFASTTGPIVIPDLQEVSTPLQVTGLQVPIDSVEVSVHLHHSYDSDLVLSLVGPDGTTVPLAVNQGGSGSDYGLSCENPARFSDQGSLQLGSSPTPFAGSFQPEFPLSAFRGKTGAAANGTWRLVVQDVAALDEGSIVCWSLAIRQVGCEDGGGGCLVPPSFVQQPAGEILVAGDTAVLTAVVSGTEPLIYQWLHDGAVLPGAEQPSLNLAAVTPSDAGSYSLRVSNPYGTDESSNAVLTVALPPTLTYQPVDVSVPAGETARLRVRATGTGPFSFSWFQGESLMPDQTNANLTLRNIQASQAGDYTAEVRSPYGVASSRTAHITVVQPPALVSLPAATITTVGGDATFATQASGTPPLSYTWFFNGTVPLPGGDGPSLHLSGVTREQAGDYSVMVSNLAGVVVSPPATLTVWEAPEFVVSPTNEIVSLHGSLSLISLATGSPAPSYSWFFATPAFTNAIEQATNSTLTLSNLAFTASGSYFAIASNSLGVATSLVAEVRVVGLPLITRQPESQRVLLNGAAQFGVEAMSEGALYYQWYFQDDTPIAGATSATLSFPSVGLSDLGSYSVSVSNSVGVVHSRSVPLEIGDAVSVVQQPLDVTAPVGGVAAFQVTATGGAPLAYQWYFDGQGPMAGETQPSLSLAGLTPANAGEYRVVVSNFGSSQTSRVVRLTVLDPPSILVQPTPIVALLGGAAQFIAEAAGSPPLQYRWFHNGTEPVDGVDTPTLSLSGLGSGDEGSYELEVSNAVGTIRSQPVPLSLIFPPRIAAAPLSRTVALGSPVAWSVGMEGTPPFGFQWYHDGSPIPGATGDSFLLTEARFSDAGVYQVEVSNPAGTATSEPRALIVLQAPVVRVPPDSQVLAIDQTLVLSVVVEGAEPLSYQWLHNGSTALDGQTAAILTVPHIQPSDAGSYSVLVSNAVGSVISRSADVRVLALPTIVEQPFDASVPRGASAQFSVQAGGGEPRRYQWFFAETTPLQDATNSVLRLNSVLGDQAGGYSVVIANEVGSVTSRLAWLVVKEVPILVQSPADQTVVAGGNASFTVEATGIGELRYQWVFQGIFALPDATNATLLLENVQPTQAGGYSVEISNSEGTITSPVAQLAVIEGPTIAGAIQERLVAVGSTVEFSPEVLGTGPLNFQWYRDAITPLVNQTNRTLQLVSVQLGDSGAYWLEVSNAAGSDTGHVGQLTVQLPPQVVTAPMSQRVVVGRPARFEVEATGSPTLLFEWRFHGELIPDGASGPVLEIASVDPAEAGDYSVSVRNSVGIAASPPVQLVVLVPPTAQITPTNSLFATGSDLSLTAEVTGTPPFRYQWIFNATNLLADATNSVLALSPLRHTDSGAYQVLVSNEAGDAPSPEAVVSVVDPPSIPGQPESLSVALGQPAGFHVIASGFEPLAYQWFFNGSEALPGENGTGLNLVNAQTAQSGGYSVRISNPVGSVTSVVAQLTVILPPSLLTQPMAVIAAIGGSAEFEVQVTGSEPMSFQWYWQGTNQVSEATNALLNLKDLQLAQQGFYSLQVSNLAGVAWSDEAELVLLEPPGMLAQPVELTVVEGGSALFEVSVSGAEPLSYQWFRSPNQAIPGASGPSLGLANVQPGDSGDYFLRATNLVGEVVSDTVHLQVLVPPQILSSPTDRLAARGSLVEFQVVATGSAPLSFGWFFNRTNPIPGATNAVLQLTNVQPAQSGIYSALVSNAAGEAASAEAVLSVAEPPSIEEQPQPITVPLGGTARFEVEADGAQPLTYQWFRSGDVPIPGAVEATLRRVNVTPEDTGDYTVRIRNAVGEVFSRPAHLEVLFPPVIVTNPLSRLAAEGSAVEFIVEVSGSHPLLYQWHRDQTNVIADATNAVLSLANVGATNNGTYSVVAQNSAGSATSAEATLTVLRAPAIVSTSADLILSAGDPALLEVQVTGDEPIGYRWLRDDALLLEASTAQLTIASVQPQDGGLYSLIATNAVGSVTSAPIRLEVWLPPLLVSGPGSRTVASGSTVQLQPVVSGTQPFAFQWFFNQSLALAGQTNPVLTLENVSLSDSGAYSVSVSNRAGLVVTPTAQLTVLDGPSIVRAPESQTLAKGAELRLGVEVSGSPPFRFQWYYDGGLAIPGATDANLILPSAQLADSGRYFVTVANEVGAATSVAATVRVLEAPHFLSEPADVILAVGQSLTLDAEVGGSPELAFQWSLFETNPIAGATTNPLVLASVSLADSGTYSLAVTNEVGAILGRSIRVDVLEPPAILSSPATLTVLSGTDASFEAKLAGSRLRYQWWKDGNIAITGATNRTLVLPGVSVASMGVYTLALSNEVGVAVSPGIGLRVLVAPSILSLGYQSNLTAVSFISLRGLHYTLENADDPAATAWRISAGSWLRKGTGGVMTLYDAPGGSRFRFYRVVAE